MQLLDRWSKPSSFSLPGRVCSEDSCQLLIIASFAVVFAISLMVLSLFSPLFSSIVQRSFLGGLDQTIGFLFGVLRGIVLVAHRVFHIFHDNA